MNDKTKQPPAPDKVKVGDKVTVLDWSRDPNTPVSCSAVVTVAREDGSIDVDVTPPEGIEPYAQVGLVPATGESIVPGTYAVVKPTKPSTPNPVPPPDSPSH